MYKHIIWDFDGTLFDTYPMITNSFKKALEYMGIKDEYEAIMSRIKVSESHAREFYSNKYFIDNKALKVKYDAFRKEVDVKDVKPFMSADVICKDIHLSKKNNYIYTNRGKSVIDFLEHYDLLKYFTDIISRENKFERKPSPEALLYLLDKHNINFNEAIMIGDRDIDILAGRNAGIKTCFFDVDQSNNVKIADYTINNIKELYAILGL